MSWGSGVPVAGCDMLASTSFSNDPSRCTNLSKAGGQHKGKKVGGLGIHNHWPSIVVPCAAEEIDSVPLGTQRRLLMRCSVVSRLAL
eukprot:2143174-Amphidinium_carterae.1